MNKKIAQRSASQSLEYRYHTTLRLVSIVTILVLSASIIAAGWFLRKTVNETIEAASTVQYLQLDPSFRPINFTIYDAVLKSWGKKQATTPPPLTNDPFHHSIVGSVTVGASTPTTTTTGTHNGAATSTTVFATTTAQFPAAATTSHTTSS